MRYAQIRQFDVANGEGIRVSIFVTGCTHNCFNCFNKEYQDFKFGDIWTKKETKKVINYLRNEHISGLSLLGGEPMLNAKDLVEVLREIKKSVDKPIWLWSGFTLEQIKKNEEMFNLLKEVDVLVDGKFVQQLKNLNLKFRGSSNQRIINVKKSLKEDKVILKYSQGV